MKVCFKCDQKKPASEFYRHPKMADGRLNKCIECAKHDVRTHRKLNDSVREYDRRRYQENPERRVKSMENARRWNAQNIDGYRAHYTVSNAVRDGRLKRKPCEACGSGERVHAHHHDYAKPLDVTWLCATCHHRHHAANR